MKNNKKKYHFWLTILVACTISKSAANNEGSIDSLLSKLSSIKGFYNKRDMDKTKELSKEDLLNKSTISSISNGDLENNNSNDFNSRMKIVKEYLASTLKQNPIIISDSYSEKTNLTFPPILFYMGQIPSTNESTVPKVAEEGDINETANSDNVIDLNPSNTQSPKKHANTKNNRLEKNPTLMESILNPFFLKAFRNNEAVKEKKQNNSRTFIHSEVKDMKLDYTTTDPLAELALSENRSAKYNLINEDLLVEDKYPRLYCKLQSVNDNLETPYFRFKSANGRRYNLLNGYLNEMNNTSNHTIIFEHRSRNNPYTNASKPVSLVDMMSNDPLGTLLNQTLLNFATQIFNILEDSSQIESGRNGKDNKLLSNVKKKFICGNQKVHNNIPYELIRTLNESERKRILLR